MPQRKSRIGGMFLCAAVVTAGAGSVSAFAAPTSTASPVVPGYEQLSAAKFSDQAALGELLIGELNCTSCHAAPQGNKHIVNKPAPDLSAAGARITPQYLRKFMTDPHGTKPGTTMPDIFHASEAQARDGAVEMLMHYLVSQGGPMAAGGAAADTAKVELGRKLFHSVGCVACHNPEQAIDSKLPGVPLPNLAMKTTVEPLAAFLRDPQKVRPGGRMPSLRLTNDEAQAIAVYLLRDQMSNPQSKAAPQVRGAGLNYAQYKGGWDKLPDFGALHPVADGKAATISLDLPTLKGVTAEFALRFTGHVEVPATGEWIFATASDDGTKLYIDGRLLVENDGVHPVTEVDGKITLTEGPHAIVVEYFQGGGGQELAAFWQGPGVKKQPIPAGALTNESLAPMIPLESDAQPFVVDEGKAAMGGKMFAVMGCAACHAPGSALAQGVPQRKALAELNADATEGCLGDAVKKGVPNYHMTAGQRDAIKAALKNSAHFATAPDPKATVLATVARLNCLACHVRDGLGGPDAARNVLFKMNSEADIGDEGRLPPKLTGVGAKLKPEALDKIVNLGQLHVRSTMATRMPQFGPVNVAALLEALPAADGAANPGETKASKATKQQLKDGRTLAGTKGLACVACHAVNGSKSLGMPAVDLATEYERVRPEWFAALLSNPQAINPGTRMPPFFDHGKSPVKTIDGGDADKQIAALYGYLSLGRSMPLPDGMQSSGTEFELVPMSDPIVHRTYFQGIDRAIAVGFPEKVHLVYDQGVPRAAKAWRGRFFDAAGMWNGRGGNHNGPLGTDILEFPAGPALAVLEKPGTPWPLQKDRWDRNIGGKFHGYRLDAERRPIFMYQLGDVKIEEQPLPVLSVGGSQLARKFTLAGDAKDLYLLAASGTKIEAAGTGVFKIDEKLTVKITGDGGAPVDAKVREFKGRSSELVVPVNFKNSAAVIEVEYTW